MKTINYAFLAALMLAGCASTNIEPLRSSADVRTLTEEEKRVWAEADNFDLSMRNGGHTYENAAATNYLQGIMDKLYPEFRGTIKVRIANSPQLNAFALPNGIVYFNLGLLARLENEAQLATVLAHESAHFILKHGYKQRQNLKNSAAFAFFVSEVLAMSSTYGYSRDLEREADMMAYQQLGKAGYDTHQAEQAFKHLAEEAKALDEKEPFFFSSHPKLEERIEVYQEMNKTKPQGGEINKQRYDQNISPLRIACLESDLSMDRYKSVLLVLGNTKRLAEYPPQARFYLAEAYQRRNDKGDEQLALTAYQTCTSTAPGFAPSYRALGIFHLKKKEYGKAEAYFAKYLQLAPKAADLDYVKNYYVLSKKGSAK